MNQLISLLKDHKDIIGKDIEKIIFKESSDNDIYKQLVNDCEFEEKFDKDENINIATLSI